MYTSLSLYIYILYYRERDRDVYLCIAHRSREVVQHSRDHLTVLSSTRPFEPSTCLFRRSREMPGSSQFTLTSSQFTVTNRTDGLIHNILVKRLREASRGCQLWVANAGVWQKGISELALLSEGWRSGLL